MRKVAFVVWLAVIVALVIAGCGNPNDPAGSGAGSANDPTTSPDDSDDSDSSPDPPDTTPPGPVSGVSADASVVKMALSWSDPVDADVASVEITWTPADGADQPIVALAGIGTATITGLRADTTYTFALTAVDTAGNRSTEKTLSETTNVLFNPTTNPIVERGTMSELKAADIDGDGVMDLIAGSTGYESVTWFEYTGGDFTGVNATTLQQKVQGVAAEDIDGDGDLDLLSVSDGARGRIPNRVAWYENTKGDGTEFVGRDISTSVDHPRAVVSADLDGDGDADVVAASYNDDRVVWYENSKTEAGDTVFSSGAEITADAPGAISVAVADLDGDGDADVLAASHMDSRVTWYENRLDEPDGDPWTATDIADTLLFAWQVLTADIDGDGDADVIAASLGDDRIVWFENTDGAGTFSNGTDVAGTLADTASVSAGDMDGDGDNDLVAVSGRTVGDPPDQIAWIENLDGAGGFDDPANISLETDAPLSIVVIDVDGDGDLDVAVGERGLLAWYENILVDD
jgi:chitodextrinase